MLIAWDNKADAAAVSAGSALSSLPASNVQAQLLATKWGTAAGVKSSYLLFDLGASLEIAVLAVLGSNLTPTATVRLRASNADATAVAGDLKDTGVIAAGVSAGYGAIYNPFDSVNARYWRVDLADAALADNMLVGRVVLAPKWIPTVGMPYGWGVTSVDPSKIASSTGGQRWADQRPQKRVVQFQLDWMNESEMFGNAFAMARAIGIVKDVLVMPFETGARLQEQSVWGACKTSPPLQHRAAKIFTQQFTVEETL